SSWARTASDNGIRASMLGLIFYEYSPPTGCGTDSAGEELQSLCDELVVKLEDAAVPGVGIDLELAVRQAFGQVNRVGRRHHAVVIAVCDEDWLLDGRQVGRRLHPPGMDGPKLGAEGSDRDRLVAILGPLLQPLDELPGLPPAIGRRGEEEVMLW